MLVSFTFQFIQEKGCDVYVHFGFGEKSCFYHINDLLMKDGEQRCNVLPFSVELLHPRYMQVWDYWSASEDYDTLTDLFEELSSTSSYVNDEQLMIIESFILRVLR